MQAQEYLRATSDFQAKTINKVTSGLRIVNAGDDAAGLAIANFYRSDQAVLAQGVRNANDAMATLQTIDGGVSNIGKLLDRARTLAAQSASDAFNGSRAVLNSEFQSVMTEIDRQSKAIGMNTNGMFAKTLSVFIGGGRGADGLDQVTNGSVSVDLSKSVVDTTSLGLSGMRATGNATVDLSTSSATTSVSSLIGDATNKGSEAVAGNTVFYFRGPGFSDNSAVKVSVNLSGVTDTATLAAAVNAAITNAGNGTSQSATAFKNAGIQAIVVTTTQSDGTVKQSLGFQGSSAAFQVEAADRMANALLGNISSGATGKMVGNSFVAQTASAAAGSTFATYPGNIVFRFAGAGLTASKDITINVATTDTIDSALVKLDTAIKGDVDLTAAGVKLNTGVAGARVEFTTSRGESLTVMAAGDMQNRFGLGAFRLDTSGNNFDYSTITGVANFASTADSANNAMDFSVGGGPTQTITFSTVNANGGAGAADVINLAIAGNAVLSKAGIVATYVGNKLTLTSNSGTAFRMAVKTQTNANLNLGFGWAAGVGAGASADNYADAIVGTATAVATTDTVNDLVYLKVNGTALAAIDVGTTANTTALAAALNGAGTFSGAGLLAASVNGKLSIVSTLGQSVEVLTGAGNFNTVAGLEAGQKGLADKATLNSGGAGATQLGNNKDTLSWNMFRYGSDVQNLAVTALDPSGAERTLSITLQSNGTARNNRSLDEAVGTINAALQASADPTLKQIVAVKEQGTDGKEGIRFLSKLPSFKVNVGTVASSTGAAEVGIYDSTVAGIGQGLVEGATASSGGGSSDISTRDAAASAVTALASAVSFLGSAQAVIGKGQNTFNFAVGLASTQLTNLAASESRIRDADLAFEAANLTKAQILSQAGVAALAQANSAPQAVLSLLRGQ
jgi:flagellin